MDDIRQDKFSQPYVKCTWVDDMTSEHGIWSHTKTEMSPKSNRKNIMFQTISAFLPPPGFWCGFHPTCWIVSLLKHGWEDLHLHLRKGHWRKHLNSCSVFRSRSGAVSRWIWGGKGGVPGILGRGTSQNMIKTWNKQKTHLYIICLECFFAKDSLIQYQQILSTIFIGLLS